MRFICLLPLASMLWRALVDDGAKSSRLAEL
jgi:hypothetical protein